MRLCGVTGFVVDISDDVLVLKPGLQSECRVAGAMNVGNPREGTEAMGS